ncbi:MAG: adenylate/guanylate cyclase domain-containing protein [Planctomycetota bacterium]
MPSSERSTVAVLFCHLPGFTRLASGRVPEEARDLIDALLTRFRALLERISA